MTGTRSRTTSAYRSHAAKRLARYLRTEVKRVDSEIYVNGDRIAEELDLPATDIGNLLGEHSGAAPGLSFSIVGSAPRTLWRVSRPRR